MASEHDSVLHSWCVQSDWRAPTVVGGSGAHLHLADGRRILDMSSLAECSNLGHQHPAIVEAIRRQAEQLCFVTSAWGAQPRAELAEAILDKAGFEGGRVFFTLAGADANENAVKFARQASGKPHGQIVTRDRSYHGASYACMALSGDARTRAQVDPAAFGVLHVPPPYAYHGAFGSHDAHTCGERAVAAVAEAIDHAGAATIAAVMMEPNAGTNGIVAPDNYWPGLREATRARQVALIADEVMSGFGRCGEWFAWQRYGDAGKPDLMTLAKGLTGAHLPLGAVVLSADMAARLEHEMLYTGLTYCGHPLSCAAGLAALRAYEQEHLIERSRTLGQRMFTELQAMQSRHAVIGDVRGGHGLFAVLELVADRTTRAPLSPWPQTPRALQTLLEAAMAEGASFACRGNLILLAPPLVIDEQDLGDALSLLDRLLARFFPAAL
ncbi:aminotransferase family protein [Dyella soli]|uniref:Aminotransferase class III-fold pyridoxal phosphate-dependent enzyme n=1 Tax=Dyella soli TaxID=522319 RepID=A0A4R0YXW9_9GAMM|nr:aminotransferase class III-fold pyridoxal phosphate-dependent enzyme [Dyella soli]TCI10374.1 aminotransferase class III-fold pyridoxal phosphate-dependent enzyme [Dyella soli]